MVNRKSLILILTLFINYSAFPQWGDFFTTNLQEERFSDDVEARIGEEISFLNKYQFRPYGGVAYVDNIPVSNLGLKINIPLIKHEFFLGLDLPAYISLSSEEKNIFMPNKYDEIQDFLDIIDYLQYGKRGEKYFYKINRLQKETIGKGAIMQDYDPQVFAATYRQLGFEFEFIQQSNNVKLKIYDLKNLISSTPSTMASVFVSASPIDKFNFSFTAVADLNEYNMLRDYDEDNVPDMMDLYPRDKNLATDFDKIASINNPINFMHGSYYDSYFRDKGWAPQYHLLYDEDGNIRSDFAKHYASIEKTYIDEQIAHGVIDTTYNLASLAPFFDPNSTKNVSDADSSKFIDLKNESSVSILVGIEADYKLIDEKQQVVDIYTHYTHNLTTSGLGAGLGIAYKLKETFGTFIDSRLEFRFNTEKFIFGQFNSTYETQKAILGPAPAYTYKDNAYRTDKNYVFTRTNQLDQINQNMVGYFLDLNFNFYNYITLRLYNGLMFAMGENEFGSVVDQDDGLSSETTKVYNSYADEGLGVCSYGIEIGLGSLISPVIHSGKIYLKQDNHITRRGDFFTTEDGFLPFARPETLVGCEFILRKTNSGSLRINWSTPFIDKNGNGTIDNWNESSKNISLIGIIQL